MFAIKQRAGPGCSGPARYLIWGEYVFISLWFRLRIRRDNH